MKDEDLFIKKAKRGDEKAFGVLYDEYIPRIYRFILLKVSRKQDAEDLTHQVFLNAWQNINRYEFRGFPFSSWLYRIAVNAVIDFYRTNKHEQRLETTPEEDLSETSELNDTVDHVLDITAVKTAVAKLEPDQQNVIIMKFVDDLSNKEVAQALEKTEGAIRVIQHRALKQLRAIFNDNKPKEA
ncbi:sigma-70 family RNA polymerase sigma factor [Candidatus Jorgensenbacteria bacterium]|nr:sigma-70 family RNA polymerase sigma factor [Candidatus Jorgensenbacteria bacterium]